MLRLTTRRERRMKANFFANMKISRKLVAVFLATSLIAMGVNIFIYFNLNQALDKINSVFASNISLNELSDNLNKLHSGLTGYLETKGSLCVSAIFPDSISKKARPESCLTASS